MIPPFVASQGNGRTMKATRILVLLAGLTTSLSMLSAGDARAGDPFAAVGEGALQVQAERLEVDVLAQTAVLTGNVSLAKGGLKVSCPRIDLKFNDTPTISWAKGSGGVSADVKGVHGEAPEVELDLTKQSLELRGGVRLTRGQGWLQAERATIDIGTGKVQLTQVKGSIPVPR